MRWYLALLLIEAAREGKDERCVTFTELVKVWFLYYLNFDLVEELYVGDLLARCAFEER